MPILVNDADVKSAANFATPAVRNGDIFFDSGGKLIWLSWQDKLMQSVLLELSLKYQDEFKRGNWAFQDIAETSDSVEAIQQQVRYDFYDALARLQARQPSNTPLAERLKTIVSVTAQVSQDRVSVNVLCVIRNGLNSTVTLGVSTDANSNIFSIKLI